MGFALWSDGDIAYCAGTHEYRPMGVGVVAATDLFAARDFDRSRKPPSRRGTDFLGLFASLNDVNRYMVRTRGKARRSRPAAFEKLVSP